jgi:RecA/RadA recombinase
VPDYARLIGCVVGEIFIAPPDDGPMALEIVDALVRCSAFVVIALDSVPGLCSPAKDGSGVDRRDVALARARLLSEAMRGLAANIDRTRTVVLGNRLAQRAADRPVDVNGGRGYASAAPFGLA